MDSNMITTVGQVKILIELWTLNLKRDLNGQVQLGRKWIQIRVI